SVTLPTASNLSSSSCVSRCCANARVSGAPARSAAVAAPTCRTSRREIINAFSMPDARAAHLLALVLSHDIELEIAIFLGDGRQFIGADVDLAPLEALADVPDRLQAGPPGREVIGLPFCLAKPLAADPVIGRDAVAVCAGKVELAELALGEVLAA